MNVAILGTRGIPAAYSGFETAVEQITSRLTARGHTVTVYCRPHVVDPGIREWKGARLVHLPTARNKYLDTFVHTLLSSIHAARATKPDVALFFIAGNSPLCLVTRLAGIPTVINVDGSDSDLLAYQYLQTLPLMAKGEANKVWVIPSDFGTALQGFTKMLGAPGEDGVFRYTPSPVDTDLPKPEDDTAEVAEWFSTATDPQLVEAVAKAEADAREPVEDLAIGRGRAYPPLTQQQVPPPDYPQPPAPRHGS